MTEPFLIGDAVTGGYGRGPDILHECTISVNPGGGEDPGSTPVASVSSRPAATVRLV